MKKYAVFLILTAVGVTADLGTKTVAEDRLASRSTEWEHYIQLVVPDGTEHANLGEFLASEFTRNTEDELVDIALATFQMNPGEPVRQGSPQLLIEEGDRFEVRRRSVTLIDDFLGFKYVENRGAAWGFLNDANHAFRRPFFIIVGLIAIGVIFMLFRQVGHDRMFLVTALSFIVGGALGNIVDRIRYGYVVDFIDWHPGFSWPTFNIADVLIVAGVIMMFIEVLRDHRREKREKAEAEAAEAVGAA